VPGIQRLTRVRSPQPCYTGRVWPFPRREQRAVPIDPPQPIRLPDEAWHPDGPLIRACRDHDANTLFRLVSRRYSVTQERIAVLVNLEAGEISKRIRGRTSGPIQHIDRWIKIADGLGMPDHARRVLFGLASRAASTTGPLSQDDPPTEEPTTNRRAVLRYAGLGVTAAALTNVVTTTGSGTMSEELDSPLEIAGRVRSVSVTNVDDTTLDLFDAMAVDLIDQYERTAPPLLTPHVLRQRRQVHDLMGAQQQPRQRDRLFLAAARLSGVLAALSLDLGNFGTARAYATEAFHLAQMLDPARDVRAWVRATQSLIEYYAGRYDHALSFARAGQRLDPDGPQTVRLAINGEARALGRLGNQRGVDEAVDRAFAWLTANPSPPRPSSHLSLGPYDAVRTSANAAAAYLAVAQPAQVIKHGTRALGQLDAQGLRGWQALTRLDLAGAHVLDRTDAEPERAAELVQQALSVPGADQFRPVVQRAHEFATTGEPWHDIPAVRDVTDAIRTLPAMSRPIGP
jgi:tetratricopeptide (TPR) repeat protein